MFSLKITGIDKAVRQLDRLEKLFDGELKKTMFKAGELVSSDAKRNFVKNKSVDTGLGLSSIGHEEVAKADEVVSIVGAGAEHMKYIETGTRPHWPPPEPIRRWAKRKLKNEKLGFLVSRKIAQKGTQSKPFLYPALEKNLAKIMDMITKALKPR